MSPFQEAYSSTNFSVAFFLCPVFLNASTPVVVWVAVELRVVSVFAAVFVFEAVPCACELCVAAGTAWCAGCAAWDSSVPWHSAQPLCAQTQLGMAERCVLFTSLRGTQAWFHLCATEQDLLSPFSQFNTFCASWKEGSGLYQIQCLKSLCVCFIVVFHSVIMHCFGNWCK